jgi:hypothetical protein
MTTNSWDKVAQLVEKHDDQENIFVKLKSGEAVNGAFVGHPFAGEFIWTGQRYELFNPNHWIDKRPVLLVFLNFFMPDQGKMKVLACDIPLFKELLKARDQYGFDSWTFQVRRIGSEVYNVSPYEQIGEKMCNKIESIAEHDLAEVICSYR